MIRDDRGIETLTLERVRCGAYAELSRRGLEQAHSVEVMAGHAAGTLVLRIEREVLGRTDRRERTERREEVVGRVPATWWDHLKLAIAERTGFGAPRPGLPKVWQWRIRYREIRAVVAVHHHLAVTKVCPHLEVPRDDRPLAHFRWLKEEPIWAEEWPR